MVTNDKRNTRRVNQSRKRWDMGFSVERYNIYPLLQKGVVLRRLQCRKTDLINTRLVASLDCGISDFIISLSSKRNEEIIG